MDETTLLAKWVIEWFKHKDMIARQITCIDNANKSILVVKKQTHDEYVYVLPRGGVKNMLAKNKGVMYFVLMNTRANVDEILLYWNDLLKNPQLRIIFSHPIKNEKWLLCPTTHDSITEREALKQGLYSLFSSVSEWNG